MYGLQLPSIELVCRSCHGRWFEDADDDTVCRHCGSSEFEEVENRIKIEVEKVKKNKKNGGNQK